MEVLVQVQLWYAELPFAYRFTIATITIVVFVSMLTFLGILISRTLNNNREYEMQEFQKILERRIQELLFGKGFEKGSANYKKFTKRYRASKLTAAQQKGLSKLILYMHRRIKGEGAKKLELFYQDMGMKRIAMAELQGRQWWVRIWHIKVLSELNMTDARKLIIPKIHSKKRDERTQAVFASMKLDGLKSLMLLPKIDFELTQWDQVVLMEQVKQEPAADVPELKPLLDSDNNSVVEFGIKLVGFFELISYKDVIKKMLTHQNRNVRLAAIKALRRMFDNDGIPILIERYDQLSATEKSELFTTIEEIGTSQCIDFLWNVVENDPLSEFRIWALDCIKTLEGSSALTKKLNELPEEHENVKFFKHSLDERI